MSDDFQQRGGSPWGSPPGGGSGNGSGRGPTPPDIDKIIKEFQENNNSSDKETYIVLLNSKLHICIVENKDLIFYNQFEYTKDNYLKYILLTFEEFKLDRNVSKLNIVDSNENFRKVKKEMKMYFKNINLYKKSIFEIIESHYE